MTKPVRRMKMRSKRARNSPAAARGRIGAIGLEVAVEPPDQPAHVLCAARCRSVKASSLCTSRSAWTQHRAWRPTSNCPASSLTITVSGRKPCALTLPHSAPSVAMPHRVRALTGRARAMPSRSRWPCQARRSAKCRSGWLGQRCDHRPGQGALAHVGQRLGIDHVIGVAGAQQIEEVQPALAGRGAEPGEVVVADLRADAVRRFVARAGVIHRDPGGRRSSPARSTSRASARKPSCPAISRRMTCRLRDVEPDRAQLGHQPRHRDLSLMVLGQHEAPQFRAEMAARRRPAAAP